MGWSLSAKLLCYATRLLRGTPEEARDVRDDLDIFLQHQERGEDLDGVVGKTPALGGVSGASIWALGEGSCSELTVIGVETDCRPGSYIRGKDWKLVSIVFKRFDERAFEEITAVLNA
jgi:hypothetical protein